MIAFLKEHWSIITNVGTVAAALIVMLLATKFPRREELEIVIKDVSKLKKDVTAIQNKIESLPTKEDIHKLNLEISGLRGDIKEIKPEIAGVKRISNLLLEHELKEKNK